MSNRFHNKWHRRSHHTYGNNSNPDAGHDPIASPEQPFLGDFSLSGSLSAVAPLSAFAAYLYTNNTGLCSYAGRVGAFIHSYGYMGANIESMVYGVSAYAPYVAIAATSPTIGLSAYADYNAIRAYSPTRAISAYGGGVAGEFGSPFIALSANGGLVGAQIYSPRTALSAYGSRIGIEVYSDNLCLSGYSPLTGIKLEADQVAAQFSSPVISLSTGGGGINIFNSRTGIYKQPGDYYGYPPNVAQSGQVVLDVGGDVWINGACTIMGDLSAYGTMSYLDTHVGVTSSMLVNNQGTDAALTVIQTGPEPIFRCFDGDADPNHLKPSLIVDGASNGWVALGAATPTAPLNIVKDSSTYQLGSANQPHVRIYDGTTNKIILGTYGTNNGGSNPGGTTNPYIGTENSVPFDILTNNDARITIQSNGNVGINDINGSNTKFSIYANDSTSNYTALSAWGATYGAIIAGGETRINYDGGGNTSINSANTNTATVNIGTTGSASSNVNVKGNTTVNYNCTTNTTSIGTGNTTGAIIIGNTGLTGGISAYGSPISLNNNAAGYTTNIATGSTTGAVTIGNTGLTGGISAYGSPISLNNNAAGYVTNIGTGTTTGAITIGNTGLTGGISAYGSPISLNNNAAGYLTNIGTGTTTGAITIGNTGLTGGVAIIGSPVSINNNAAGYATNIATGTTSGNIQIGNTTSSTAALVGIGTSPSVRLDISNSTSAPKSVANAAGTVVHVTQVEGNAGRILVDAFGSVSTARASFTGRTAAGTVATPTATAQDTVLCEFTGQGYGATNYSSTSRGRMTINAAENWSDTAQGTYLTFQTTAATTTTTSEAARIDSSGNFLIGTTSGSAKLTVNGTVTTSGGDINLNTTGTNNVSFGNSTGNNTQLGANIYINNNASTNATNISTGSTTGTVTIGNNTSGATTTINGATTTLGGTTVTLNGATVNVNGTTVNIGSATTSTLNIGTLAGLNMTEGNSTGSHTLNSNNITAPNQTSTVANATVITGTLGDTRYGNYVNNRTAGSANTTATFNTTNLVIGSVTLAANTTYQIEAAAILATSTTGGSKVTFAGDGTLVFSVVSIEEFSYSSASTACVGATYTGTPASTTITTNTSTKTSAGAETHTYKRSGFITTGATGGVLYFQHAGNSAGNTTPQTGSYLIARKIV